MTIASPMPSPRDPRLDVFRGLALVTIFIDHVPGNFWQNFTSHNFGLSDAAEGFVLIAGISAALAYGHWFQPGSGPRQTMIGIGHIWHRVWTIYLVHILITVLTLGVILAVARWFGDAQLRHINKMDIFLVDPGGAMLRIPLLIQQLDYVDILPMYLILLVFTPLALWLGWRAGWLLLGLSVVLWWATNSYQLNLPNHPSPEGWFFNPLAWQLIFVIGLLIGTTARQGRRLIPAHPVLLIAALAVLILGLAWMRVPAVGEYLWGLMWQAQQDGAPAYVTGFEKTYLPLPRLLHALALTYVLTYFPQVRRVCNSVILAPFALLGRQGLLVFATGSVICVGLQTVRQRTGTDFVLDTVMMACGLTVLFMLAAAKQYWPKDREPTGANRIERGLARLNRQT